MRADCDCNDLAARTEFATTVAGGAAALAGLLLVGLSLNLTEVLAFAGVSARAAATLGLTVGHPVAVVDRRRNLVVLHRGGGLYWITTAVATGFASSTVNARVLLVEIKR